MKFIVSFLAVFCIFLLCLAPTCSKSPETFFDAGKRLAEKKQHLKAYRCFSRAIKLNPTYSEAYWERAKSEIALDSIERAIDDITVYIDANPERVLLEKAYVQRAALMFKQGYKSDACSDWTTACDLNQSNYPCEQFRLYCK